MKELRIYTDGSYKPSLKLGACAFLIVEGDEIVFESAKVFPRKGSKINVTNNTMEMLAVLNALNWVKSNGFSPKENRIYVYTDSQYVQLGLTEWINKWRINGWKTASGGKVLNKKLWTKLYNLGTKINKEYKYLYIAWVKGHDGNKYNERADKLCNIAINSYKLKN